MANYISTGVSAKMRKYFDEVMTDMKNANVPFDEDHIVGLKYMSGKRTTGLCHRSKKGTDAEYTISISKFLKTEWDIKSCMAHELIHTSIFDEGHSVTFFKYIDKMHEYNENYLRLYGGGNTKKNATSDKYNTKMEHKYTITCSHCGNVGYRDRYCGVIENSSRYICTKCKQPHTLMVTVNY